MNYKYIVIAVLTVFFSCESESEKQNDLIVFENATEYDENSISLRDFRFVKLDNNIDAIVGEDIKIKFYNKDIYILDIDNQNVLLRFDGNGSFINKIGKMGRGPKEYAELYDFCINRDTINILAFGQGTNIFRYSLNGDFIETNKTPYNLALSIEQLPEGNYLINPYYLDKSIDRLIVLDKTEKEVNKFLPVTNENWNNFQSYGIALSNIDDMIVFGDFYTDTIYRVTNSEVVPKYVMDFGHLSNQNIDYESYDNKRELIMNETRKGLWFIRKCYETRDYLLVEYWGYKTGSDLKSRLLLYNKKDKKTTSLILDSKESLRDNFMGLTKDNEMVFIMYPVSDEIEEFHELFPDAMLPTLEETDNAMIVFCKL